MAQPKNQSLHSFIKLFKESLSNFFQQAQSIFPPEFLTNVNTIIHPEHTPLEDQNLTLGNQLLEINELCIYHMAQKINDITQSQPQKSSIHTIRDRPNQIQLKDYQVLEEAVQKAEQEIRKHIGIEHQMKICLQELQDELDNLTQESQDLKKENNFLKKQLSATKKKQIQVLKKLTQTEEKISVLEQKFRINKPNSKLNTEPQSNISHDHSHKSLKKSFDSIKEKQKSSKKQILTKTGCYSKLGSRKTSKIGLMSNQIDVNLHNFVTLNAHIKKQVPTKTQGKEVFWNKRLKKKEAPTAHGVYADSSLIQQSNQNRSLNISPRQLKRQQKQKDLKDVYATNSREMRNPYQPTIHDDTATKKKQRRDYSNAEAYQIKRSTLGKGFGVDRSRSVAY